MASSTWPDGSPKSVDDIEYEALGAMWGIDGIYGSPSDSSAVFGDSTGRQVKFRAGKYGQVHGKGWASGATDITKPIAANATGQPRIDLAVLGLDRTTWLATEYILTGTAAPSPVPPALTRTAMGTGTGKWEIPLARVAVAAGASTISAADVTPVHPWIGVTATQVFSSYTAMTSWPAVTGNHGVVDGHRYVNTGSAWRRAEWDSAWGVVGGRVWTGTGAFSNGIVASQYQVTGFETGNVNLVAGRRYALEAFFHAWRPGSSGGMEFYLRDTNLVGPVRGYTHVDVLAGQGYMYTLHGRYDCQANETKNFVLIANTSVNGTLDVSRPNDLRAYYEVRDIGPHWPLTYTHP